MADEFGYVLDNVPATSVASEDIDKTFRSSDIGSFLWHALSITESFFLSLTRCDEMHSTAVQQIMYKVTDTSLSLQTSSPPH